MKTARASGLSHTPPGTASARRVALDALDRVEADGAYANLVVPKLLDRSELSARDRRFVTDLVYGTTRMRRGCDFLVDQHLSRPPVSRVRNALRLGAYQLAFGEVPPHAAVAETVAVAPRPARGLVNAVLRKVAREVAAPGWPEWPDDATRLSVPDWLLAQLVADLGRDSALAALTTMNRPGRVAERPDGYVQDLASQQVASAVDAAPGETVLDVCAAPGGKATALATDGARVVAADVRASRLGLVRDNARRLDLAADVLTVAADGRRPPWRPSAFDRVLVDAPCSGLGTLRRRPDLRWRVDQRAVDRLAHLQRALVGASVEAVRSGGVLVFSVCTLTRAESLGVDALVAAEHPELVPLDPPGRPWEPWGRGAILLPQAADTDGMCLFRYRRR
ncbi:MAG: transcription antitermination factor NusB [Acidimicrobiales bacterium]